MSTKTPEQLRQKEEQPLTNFSPKELPIYERAIRTFEDRGLFIRKEPAREFRYIGPVHPIAGDYSLWRKSESDGCLSDFWKHFRAIEQEMRPL